MLDDGGCVSESRFEQSHALEWPVGAALNWGVIGGHPVMLNVQIVIRLAKWLPCSCGAGCGLVQDRFASTRRFNLCFAALGCACLVGWLLGLCSVTVRSSW